MVTETQQLYPFLSARFDTYAAALIDNDYTASDSLPFEMLGAEQRIPVTIAVANLYLRKQIIFERAL